MTLSNIHKANAHGTDLIDLVQNHNENQNLQILCRYKRDLPWFFCHNTEFCCFKSSEAQNLAYADIQ